MFQPGNRRIDSPQSPRITYCVFGIIAPLRFEYRHVDIGSYAEIGGGVALSFRNTDQHQLVLAAGVDAHVEATEQLDITARVETGVDVVDDDTITTGSFLRGGPAFVLSGLEQDAARFRGGLGLKYHSRGDRTSLHVRYDAEVRDDFSNQLLSAQFRLRF